MFIFAGVWSLKGGGSPLGSLIATFYVVYKDVSVVVISEYITHKNELNCVRLIDLFR